MKFTTKHKAMLGLALTIAAVVFLFFFNLYRHDMNALAGFLECYGKYDNAISEFSKSALINPDNELERKSEEALSELKAKAALLSGISSLIKNDSVIPPTAKEIVDFSENELDQLCAIKSMIWNKEEMSTHGLDSLSSILDNLNKNRKDAFEHFKSLGE